MIEFLAANGFFHSRNTKGITLLGQAAFTNNYDIAAQLVLRGAGINLQFTNGDTALHVAAEYGNYEIALLLLNHGAHQYPNDEGDTPLHVAGLMKLVELLVERGGDINARNSEGETPLHCATHLGFLDYMKYLISKGVDVDATSCYGRPIEMAIVKGRIDAMEILLQAGAKLDFDKDVPRLLAWLQDKIDSEESGDPADGLKDRVGHLIAESISTRDLALAGNHAHFVEMLRTGEPFYLRQVVPNLPDDSREIFMHWTKATKRDMHSLYVLFHYDNLLTPLIHAPSPITECLKEMLLLPKRTRAML